MSEKVLIDLDHEIEVLEKSLNTAEAYNDKNPKLKQNVYGMRSELGALVSLRHRKRTAQRFAKSKPKEERQ